MPAVVNVLWCVAALSGHVIPTVSTLAGAEHHLGRLSDKRISYNDTGINVVSTSPADPVALGSSRVSVLDAVGSSFSLTSASLYAVSHPTTTSLAKVATVTVGSTTNQAVSSESDPFLSLLDLGTITTLARPPLAFTSTATRTSKVTTPSSISSVPLHLNSSSTASAIISSNNTSLPWNWNSTASLTSPTTALTLTNPPLPTTSTTFTTNENTCPSSKSGDRVIVTSYTIVYTSTTTWTGDPADYTPPFPTISTPEACTPPRTSPTGRLTVSVCDGTGKTCTPLHSSGDPTGDTTSFTGAWAPTETAPVTQTVTFVTTDKNPAVVFSSVTPPGYGGSPASPDSHGTASGRRPLATPDYGMVTPWVEPAKTAAMPMPTRTPTPAPGNGVQVTAPVTVVVQPGEVVLNHETFADNPERATSTVVVAGGNTFVIDPSRVIGAGATITRPPNGGGIFVDMPMTTTIGDLEVVYGPSIATIDGTAFTVGSTPTSATIRGQQIAIEPGGIVFPSQTLFLPVGAGTAGPTEVAVMGGELITAIGSDRVVIEGTTVTYGTASSTTTEVIDGDTVLVGPSGVVVHAKTLGGVAAAPDAIAYEMVGGVTMTRLGPTAVFIEGVTYRMGYGAAETTVVVGGRGDGDGNRGETITVGPGGVAVSTWTFGFPYAWTTTMSVANNAAVAAIPTTAESLDNSGQAARPPPGWGLGFGVSCIAIGAGVLGPLLFWA
ncbi:hypothetical protein F5X99DRAFT_279229 [Biscogniauxia marginata]|nr:hypothetical protein F5X99DRAFT_279229 [Biscogniauxia marginata]